MKVRRIQSLCHTHAYVAFADHMKYKLNQLDLCDVFGQAQRKSYNVSKGLYQSSTTSSLKTNIKKQWHLLVLSQQYTIQKDGNQQAVT